MRVCQFRHDRLFFVPHAAEACTFANFATYPFGTEERSLHPMDRQDNLRVREISQLKLRELSHLSALPIECRINCGGHCLRVHAYAEKLCDAHGDFLGMINGGGIGDRERRDLVLSQHLACFGPTDAETRFSCGHPATSSPVCPVAEAFCAGMTVPRRCRAA